MFNLGFGEILVICVILIIVVGPERLPAVMKNVGKTLRSVRQASREIQTTVGLDELWREDVLNTPPRPRVPPAATVSREPEAPAAPSAAAGPDAAAAASASSSGTAPALRGGASIATEATPPAPGAGGGKGEA